MALCQCLQTFIWALLRHPYYSSWQEETCTYQFILVLGILSDVLVLLLMNPQPQYLLVHCPFTFKVTWQCAWRKWQTPDQCRPTWLTLPLMEVGIPCALWYCALFSDDMTILLGCSCYLSEPLWQWPFPFSYSPPYVLGDLQDGQCIITLFGNIGEVGGSPLFSQALTVIVALQDDIILTFSEKLLGEFWRNSMKQLDVIPQLLMIPVSPWWRKESLVMTAVSYKYLLLLSIYYHTNCIIIQGGRIYLYWWKGTIFNSLGIQNISIILIPIVHQTCSGGGTCLCWFNYDDDNPSDTYLLVLFSGGRKSLGR